MQRMKTENNLASKIDSLCLLLSRHPGFCVLTGAGCSTASGLPAYRNLDGDWQHERPMEHQDFIASELMQKIYWSRSQHGWPNFHKARPNQTHALLTELQHRGFVRQIITQNVDGLHQASGSDSVIELHGRLDQVICLDCSATFSRQAFQTRLASVNPLSGISESAVRPDGDVDLAVNRLSGYSIPRCERCEGTLKPDVVFFGGVLDPQIAADAQSAVENSPGLMVVGSSLMVYSGFRLVKRALTLEKPVVIINRGTTRADDLHVMKIDHESGQVLSAVTRSVCGSAFQ